MRSLAMAVAAGKDVYVEMPCSHNLREGQWGKRAIALARHGVIGKVRIAKAWNVQLRNDVGRKADSMNLTFSYPGGEALLFEQRIRTPYGIPALAVNGAEGMVEIGRWDQKGATKCWTGKGS